jgi:Domain of unknown function (DU1801)
MTELKTRPTLASAGAFIDAITDPVRREHCRAITDMMAKATASEPVMWGSRLVGFGTYRYTYASGHTADWFLVGFAPRKADISVYIIDGFTSHAELLSLGRHKTGKSCLYLRSLDEIDKQVLQRLITASVRNMKSKYA